MASVFGDYPSVPEYLRVNVVVPMGWWVPSSMDEVHIHRKDCANRSGVSYKLEVSGK